MTVLSQVDNLVSKTVLPHGLTVVSERIPGIRSVSLGVWVKAGSRTDTLDKMGMAHFIEHMLFKGTATRSPFDIANELESLGGTLNAFTTRNITCYYACVLDEHLPIAVDVLSDMISNSVLPPDEIDREKSVVIEEIHSASDVPEELVQDSFTDLVLNPLPEGKPILGTDDTVNSILRSDITDYMSRLYTPKNIVIAAAGNLTHEQLVREVEKRFSSSYISDSGSFENSTVNTDKRMVISRDIAQSHICIGGKTIGYNDSRHVTLWLLSTILGSGMSSRLFQNIREKLGLAYSIYSFTELLASAGIFATYAATDVINQEKVIQLILKEYRKAAAKKVSKKTLTDAKNQMIGGLVLSLESSYNRMTRLAKNEIYFQEYREIDDTIHRITRVTPDEICDLSETLFADSNIKTVIVAP